VFPLAGFFSFISNAVQIRSQISNLEYIRRFKAEISNGIGNFMQCLQIICQLAIMVNAGIIYFTSRTYRYILVGGNPEVMSQGWDLVQYLILVIAIEHILLLLKIFIEQGIEDTPHEVVKGERERNQILLNYKEETNISGVLETLKQGTTVTNLPFINTWKVKTNVNMKDFTEINITERPKKEK
jgi:hypothetical protein